MICVYCNGDEMVLKRQEVLYIWNKPVKFDVYICPKCKYIYHKKAHN